jgi:hypothetical protein
LKPVRRTGIGTSTVTVTNNAHRIWGNFPNAPTAYEPLIGRGGETRKQKSDHEMLHHKSVLVT